MLPVSPTRENETKRKESRDISELKCAFRAMEKGFKGFNLSTPKRDEEAFLTHGRVLSRALDSTSRRLLNLHTTEELLVMTGINKRNPSCINDYATTLILRCRIPQIISVSCF